MKKALVSGITGQDGAYLAEFLLSQGYEVHGVVRRSASAPSTPWRLQYLNIDSHVRYHDADLCDLSSLMRVMADVNPDEIYNLAAQSFVGGSWQQPILTGEVTGLGAVNMLEAMRLTCPDARFYQASSSEMFGKVREHVQSETTPFYPRSPYACAKLYAHWMTINYRESYGLHASCGILFNHESPLRGLEFVTRKITDGVARIHLGLADKLVLGNLDAKRDWGHARDYVRAMFYMLQKDKPDDFVIATGKTYSIAEFCDMAFSYINADWRDYVVTSDEFKRPAEVDLLCGDATKALRNIGWAPFISLSEMVEEMVGADLRRISDAS